MASYPTPVLWGYHPVREALRAQRRKISLLYIVQDKEGDRSLELVGMAQGAGIEVQPVTARELTKLVGNDRHQGIAARTTPYPYGTLETILASSTESPVPALLLILDHVVDPQNFGAIARTAHCAGVQGIIIPKDRSAPPSTAASKASAGALEHMAVACESNLTNTINVLKKQGIWIYGADRGGSHNLFDLDLTLPLALVIGGEEKGIRPLVKKQCDYVVSIPQKGVIGSLNASAAAAVMLYEIFRQRLVMDSKQTTPMNL